MRKVFWLDTETTGLNAKENSMIQLAGLIEIDGVVKRSVNILFRPLKLKKIDPVALQVNGRTVEEIEKFPPAQIGIAQLKAILKKYVNPFDKDDKFVPAGYNVNFDLDFLRETWAVVGDKYGPGSFLFNCPYDVRTDASKLILYKEMRLKNYKLITVCDCCGIDIGKAHDPMNDIIASRELSIYVNNALYGKKKKKHLQAVKQKAGGMK